jgi:phage I-like protein
MSDDIDNRVLELIERLDARAARLEEGFQILTRLAQNHDSQLDTQRDWVNRLGSRMEELASAQANSEQKIAALADAQIRTEEALARLASAQAHTDGRLDALIDIVRGMQGGRG